MDDLRKSIYYLQQDIRNKNGDTDKLIEALDIMVGVTLDRAKNEGGK